jgi:phenylacetic acid degradation operon negative regulatory protein
VPRPAAKSLVLDLLSTLPRGAMPVRTLVDAGALFGLAGNNVRVALARLLASGLVERDERGLYRLGTRAEGVSRQVASWRTVEERVRPWAGGWVGVHTAGLARGDRRAARLRTRALRLLGFRTLVPGLELRPDNLAGGVAAVREQLGRLGIDPETPVFALGELDAATDARARRLWHPLALRAGYRKMRAAIAESEARLPDLAIEAAMAESFRIGGQAIRQIVLDPLLPEPIVPAAERAALVAAMRRYDRVGRSCWAEFMRATGVTGLRTPADLRMMESAAGGFA